MCYGEQVDFWKKRRTGNTYKRAYMLGRCSKNGYGSREICSDCSTADDYCEEECTTYKDHRFYETISSHNPVI